MINAIRQHATRPPAGLTCVAIALLQLLAECIELQFVLVCGIRVVAHQFGILNCCLEVLLRRIVPETMGKARQALAPKDVTA